jgi:hypothetical protein
MSKPSHPRRRPTSARPSSHRFRPTLESIESRLLLSGTYTVNSFGNTGGGSGNSGDLTYCITQADNHGGGTINFASNMHGTISLGPYNYLPAISQNITITGPGASVLTIAEPRYYDGEGGNYLGHRVFSILSGDTASISGLTLYGGYGQFGKLGILDGGGAINNAGTLTVTGVSMSYNTGISGGAILRNGA